MAASQSNAPGLDLPVWTRISYGTKRLSGIQGKLDKTYLPTDAHNVHGPGKAIIDGMATAFKINDCQSNVRDLGAEVDKESTTVKLTLHFTPLKQTTQPNPNTKETNNQHE